MPQPLGHRRALAAVSAAQLASELAGMVVGLRRRHPYDVFWMQGDPATITRDAVFRGTALSAPVPNMLIQAAMTAVVVDGQAGALPKRWAAGEPLWSPGTWVSGWCDSACAHQAGTPWSRPGRGHGRARPARLAPDAGALL
jgi:hypothetical protein